MIVPFVQFTLYSMFDDQRHVVKCVSSLGVGAQSAKCALCS